MLSQEEKNKKMSRLEKRLERIEEILLKIGNTGTPANLRKNETLLAEYEQIQNRISYIQFHM